MDDFHAVDVAISSTNLSRNLLPGWQTTAFFRGGIVANMTTTPTRIHPRYKRLFLDEWFEYRCVNDEKVGNRLGVHRTTVWKWRAEPQRLDTVKLGQLAWALDCEPGDLWRDPRRPSVDALLSSQSDTIHEMALGHVKDIVKRFGKTG